MDLKRITDLIGKNKADVEKGNKTIVVIIDFINSLHKSIKELQDQSTFALKEIYRQKHMKDEMNSKASIVESKSSQIGISMNEQENAIEEVAKSIELTTRIVQNNSDNTLLAVAFDDHSIGIWDRTTKKKIMQLFGPDNAITDLQFSPDGTLLLSSSLDGTIRVWGIP